MIENDLSID